MKVANRTYVNEALGASKNYAAIPLQFIYGFAAQAIITGTVGGTLKVQASCDLSPLGDGTDVTNWTDIASSSYTVANAGSNLWNFDAAYYTHVRFVWTNTSGSGTIKINVNMKSFE